MWKAQSNNKGNIQTCCFISLDVDHVTSPTKWSFCLIIMFVNFYLLWIYIGNKNKLKCLTKAIRRKLFNSRLNPWGSLIVGYRCMNWTCISMLMASAPVITNSRLPLHDMAVSLSVLPFTNSPIHATFFFTLSSSSLAYNSLVDPLDSPQCKFKCQSLPQQWSHVLLRLWISSSWFKNTTSLLWCS